MSGQRSAAQPPRAAGRTEEAASAATYLASGHRIPAALVGFRKSSLHSTYCVSLSLSPRRLRSAAAEASSNYTRLQPGSERGRKAHRSGGAGTRECALGLKDDVAAGSSGRRRRRAPLPHCLVIPKASLVSPARPLRLRPPARPCAVRPPTRLFESFGLLHCRRRHGSRKPACVRACVPVAVPVRRRCKYLCTDYRGTVVRGRINRNACPLSSSGIVFLPAARFKHAGQWMVIGLTFFLSFYLRYAGLHVAFFDSC